MTSTGAEAHRSALGDIGDLTQEAWDPLHLPRHNSGHWTTTNVGEALPGVPTPLGWSMWAGTQQSVRDGFHAIGALSGKERLLPADPDQHFLWAFYGRPAMRIEMFAELADRLPGTSGPAVAMQLLGYCPPSITAHPSYRRWPVVAAKLPIAFATVARRVNTARAETETWYRARIGTVDQRDLTSAIMLFGDACRRFQDNIGAQCVSIFGAVQPIYEQLTLLANKAGVDPNAIMGGYGAHAETEMVIDLWRASRGELTVAQVAARHGYHGPMEGEISAVVWREDPKVLDGVVADYARLPDERSPERTAADLLARRIEMERELLARLPKAYQPVGRGVLAAARTNIPLRGTAKVAFVQAIDVARAAARRIGVLLTEEGTLSDPDDVFYLTSEEVLGRPRDVADLIARRRARRLRYQRLDVPTQWAGIPTPYALDVRRSDGERDGSPVQGIGVSAGVVEGLVRVVLNPDFSEIGTDEVLVAPFTDPSWASIMYLSKALVVDIGGALSHAAIVARELGIPCVVNTGSGTTQLRTGDRVRVDGSSGRVDLLEPTS